MKNNYKCSFPIQTIALYSMPDHCVHILEKNSNSKYYLKILLSRNAIHGNGNVRQIAFYTTLNAI